MPIFEHFLFLRVDELTGKPQPIHMYSPGAEKKLPPVTLDFLYPDLKSFENRRILGSEHYAFVMTRKGGIKQYGYCMRRMQAGAGAKYPEVICILSKHPFHCFFKAVLECIQVRWLIDKGFALSLLRTLAGVTGKQVHQNVLQLRIDGPKFQETMMFPVDHPIDYPFMRDYFCLLMKIVSPDDLLLIFNAMLLEKRIVVVAESLTKLSNVVHALVGLLYPLRWQHIFLPILPLKHIHYTCAPMPFFVGMHRDNVPVLEQQPLSEVVLVDLDARNDAPTLSLMGGESDSIPSILPIELTAKLRKRLKWGEARTSPRFIQSCFTAFFAVLFHPCDWSWAGVTGKFDERALALVQSESPDLFPCLKAMTHSQMFEVFADGEIKRVKDKVSGMPKPGALQTFDLLVQLCKENPTSFKLALKTITNIHAKRYKANDRLLPPLPKANDLLGKLAHATVSNTKSITQKARSKFSKLAKKWTKKKGKKLEEDHMMSSPEESVADLDSPGRVSAINQARAALGFDAKLVGGGAHGGQLLRPWVDGLTPFPAFHKTAREFTANNASEKREDSDMLRELAMGSAHAVGATHIMDVVFERLNDCKSKSWRHASQALTLLLHLIEKGGDWVVFRAMQEKVVLIALRSYRHSKQDVQGKIRELATRVCWAIDNIFALRRVRKYAKAEDASGIAMGFQGDPWAAAVKAAARATGEKGRQNKKVVRLRSEMINRIRMETLIDGRGCIVPSFPALHKFQCPGPTPAYAPTRSSPPSKPPPAIPSRTTSRMKPDAGAGRNAPPKTLNLFDFDVSPVGPLKPPPKPKRNTSHPQNSPLPTPGTTAPAGSTPDLVNLENFNPFDTTVNPFDAVPPASPPAGQQRTLNLPRGSSAPSAARTSRSRTPPIMRPKSTGPAVNSEDLFVMAAKKVNRNKRVPRGRSKEDRKAEIVQSAPRHRQRQAQNTQDPFVAAARRSMRPSDAKPQPANMVENIFDVFSPVSQTPAATKPQSELKGQPRSRSRTPNRQTTKNTTDTPPDPFGVFFGGSGGGKSASNGKLGDPFGN